MTDAQRTALDQALAGAGDRIAGLVDQAVEGARRELADSLNQIIRALRMAPDAATWKETLMDGVGQLSRRSLLVRLDGEQFQPEAARGLPLPGPFAAVSAPAIQQTIDSLETVVAARAAGELSPAVAPFGGSDARRLFVFPLPAESPAALVVESPVQVSAIELLTTVAAMAIERIRRERVANVTLIAPAPSPSPAAAAVRPAWESLPREDRELHLRAQRFARTRVAEWQLREAAAVAAGAQSRRLYANLKPLIDAAREQYRNQFLERSGMVDYLHVEIVRTLLADEEELLGDDYPGPLA